MGDSQLPPTEHFSGIKFNPDFYQATSSEYLTATTGKNYFYRIQQHKELKKFLI